MTEKSRINFPGDKASSLYHRQKAWFDRKRKIARERKRVRGLSRRLCELLKATVRRGGVFYPLTEVDRVIERKETGIFLKHDVHGLPLEHLVKFARTQWKKNIRATYFFMAPGHPHTVKRYSFEEQVRAMKAVRDLGHEIGLHIDPFFLMGHYDKPLPRVMEDIISGFRDHGIVFSCGNLHGNTSCRLLDNNGFDAAFDLFEEIAWQPDYPVLKDVPPETADLIRRNRISLSGYGFTHWGDIPLWSAQYGHITMSYATDNFLNRDGTIMTFIPDSPGSYTLSDWQPPGPFTPPPVRELVPAGDIRHAGPPPGEAALDFGSTDMKRFFQSAVSFPTQILIHPQFYLFRSDR